MDEHQDWVNITWCVEEPSFGVYEIHVDRAHWDRAMRLARRRFAVERGRHLSSMRSSYRRRSR